MMLTRRQIAEAIAGNSDEAEIEHVSNQVKHLTETGILEIAGFQLKKNVGRGRARLYPHESVWWCAIGCHMVDRGFGVVTIAAVLLSIALHKKTKNENILDDAIYGKKPVFILAEYFILPDDEGRGSILPNDKWTSWRVDPATKELPEHWRSGFWLNLTEIFAGVRRS